MKRFKTIYTLYFDYDYGYFDWNKPDPDKKCGEDYYYLRRGTIFDCYEGKEEIGAYWYMQDSWFNSLKEFEDECNVMLIDKHGNYFKFKDMEELYNDKWFKEVRK